MPEPLAYHITWTTYGTWLPGDARGWVKDDQPGIQEPNQLLESQADASLTQDKIFLSPSQRELVTQTIREHCRIRGWTLHAVNVRSNHVHVVVSASLHPDQVMGQFKAWCSRRLNESMTNPPAKWWTKHGSTKWINDTNYLEEAIEYVAKRQ